jgi:hypothetical protein
MILLQTPSFYGIQSQKQRKHSKCIEMALYNQ